MGQVSILDCTLRDGGYCNEWKFGKKNIAEIIDGLEMSKIDIIECGYVTDRISGYDPDYTKYRNFSDLEGMIPENKRAMYVAMINYGEYDAEAIPENTSGRIDGIRVAFHKSRLDKALEFCRRIKEKGYKVFVQPMLAMSYSDIEFISLITKVNELAPYAMYIVDSFGSMKKNELLRLYYLMEHNLDADILLGFHSHNNLQLAYSNTQTLLSLMGSRSLIIDSSIMGMGRGAGNLNSELIIQEINEGYGADYSIVPILNLIDRIIGDFYKQNYWGYSLANYLSATYNLHPNYANYLANKDTLSFEAMNAIFSAMPDEKRFEYESSYIEKIYLEFMEKNSSEGTGEDRLSGLLAGKKAFIIAPGKSIDSYRNKIAEIAARDDVASFSVNFVYPFVDTDFIFIGNRKRLSELDAGDAPQKSRVIAASNVPFPNPFARLSYSEIINDNEAVRDNSSLMILKYLIGIGVKEIYIAGMDGYSYDSLGNYSQLQHSFIKRSEDIDRINKGLTDAINKMSESADIHFVTPSIIR